MRSDSEAVSDVTICEDQTREYLVTRWPQIRAVRSPPLRTVHHRAWIAVEKPDAAVNVRFLRCCSVPDRENRSGKLLAEARGRRLTPYRLRLSVWPPRV